MKTAALIYIAVILLVVYGWVCNLIAVVHALTANDPFTPLVMGRMIGIPVFILGAILGFF
ncbi:MAG: hypothetical protein EOR11_20040 [Mesorhizobium sp.]|uniref:hypothetical protein n=1 Tax=Mesorhizobium sp. TaxID=1871066 RepID=UPI000FE9CD59|nr:hypothetical protein [Mesorhizobium sp.]RWP84753.1 MAG: hypothetical protein EOR11_20040 [Mesorhizobium sp.]